MLDLVGAAAIGRRQDYLGAPYMLLFGVAIPDDGLQPKAIPVVTAKLIPVLMPEA